MPLIDRLLLRRRAIIESVIDQLQNISQIEHSRPRFPVNFLVNLVCRLIAYCHQPKKPALVLDLHLRPASPELTLNQITSETSAVYIKGTKVLVLSYQTFTNWEQLISQLPCKILALGSKWTFRSG
ncbi:hypothetical protein DO97_17140 [Neosynechococcus sphagnicola sy1]|uniref:Transposase DDE domain-containing protein n=1 Tax=Neosynechococcus sphagnicola sy1 TaxID=1497020 RepID=A0A098TGD9_9CYAN|nr:hypothetical protein DO97_17140 [Neosynechococcus sphagnicola sy1]